MKFRGLKKVNANTCDLLLTAKQIIQDGGSRASQIPLCHRGVLRNKENGDIVTQGDLKVQDHVIKELKKQFPKHGFNSEEMEQDNPKAKYLWILDPIDGTKYYTKGIPLYSVSLALRRYDKLLLGVVYCPELNQLYCASLDEQATLNDKPIHCSTIECIEQASLYLEIPASYSTRNEQRWALEKMSLLIEHAYRVRIIGVGSLGLCFCASGGFDAYINLGYVTKPHDTAAGEVIIRKSNGEFYNVGKQGKQIIAGPAVLCNKIRNLISL